MTDFERAGIGGPPQISVILPTLNALPHVEPAIEGLRRQTFRNFELVIQDGGSQDGTLAYFESLTDFQHISVVSAKDSGIGQAYNRGMSRARGAYIILTASDEILKPRALEVLLAAFETHPDAGVCCGNMELVDGQGRLLQTYVPPPFDLLRVMRCDVVPSAAGMLSRAVLGGDLVYDETLQTCPDYDFWLRVGSRLQRRQFVRIDETLITGRGDAVSMSARPEAFPAFCRDKTFALGRMMDGQPPSPFLDALRASAICGIYCWAAEMVHGMEGCSTRFLDFVWSAQHYDRHEARVDSLRRRILNLEAFERGPPFQGLKLAPTRDDAKVLRRLVIQDGASHLHWGVTVLSRDPWQVRAGDHAWSYAYQLPIGTAGDIGSAEDIWLFVDLRVHAGRVGLSLLKGDTLLNEQFFGVGDDKLNAKLAIEVWSDDLSLIIRNGGVSDSEFTVLSADIVARSST